MVKMIGLGIQSGLNIRGATHGESQHEHLSQISGCNKTAHVPEVLWKLCSNG